MNVGQQHAPYSLEECRRCDGRGQVPESGTCQACRGNGSVMVHQPAISCPRCGGSGAAQPGDGLAYDSSLCTVCLGTGWVRTEFHQG
jgi:DnaJ-class molecular chaperone